MHLFLTGGHRPATRGVALAGATLLSVGLAVAAPAAAAAPAAPAAATEPGARAGYIVVLKDGVAPGAAGRAIAAENGGRLGHVYQHALNGFSVTLPEAAAARLARDPRVASVERDQVVTTTAQEVPTGVRRAFAAGNPGLDIDGADDARVDVDIAIIDSGLDSDHPDLNIAGGTDCTTVTALTPACGSGFEDANGHGTHVGGSAAALDNGVGVVGTAPGARLHGVKVLGADGSGLTSWTIAGIDWVTARADVIEVANMSLGCECTSAAQDTAIRNSVAAGITYVVAAGNSAKDAATFSPANHPDVVTVSAIADFNGLAGGGAPATCRADRDDTLADFSNFGSRVELAAPGTCILSTWPGGGLNTISGTSMASPHAAGAAAVLASTRPTASKADADAIRNLLISSGNLGWTDERQSTTDPKEPLLDLSDAALFAPRTVGSGTQQPAEPAPAPAITLTARGYKVKTTKNVDLSWSGAKSTSVDVVRNGSRVATTNNDGAHTDVISGKGGGSFTYRVCEAGTATCSPDVTVTF